MKKANELLPIGSVVLLKNGTKKVMITGFYTVSEKNPNEVYDYIGCLYPEGIISSDKNLLFNHEQIANIYYNGYVNEEEKEFKQKLQIAVDKLSSTQNNN